MKKIMFFCLVQFLCFNFYAQQNIKAVTLKVIGNGRDKEDAKINAFRNALEPTYGTFISSNTEVLNDNIIKDEIVSISSGNIQKYDIISENKLPDGSYSICLNVTISLLKLNSFCENKGLNVEFKGGLFSANVKMQELNYKNEESVINNLRGVLDKISKNIFDYEIKVDEPIKNNEKRNARQKDWKVPILVHSKFNKNFNEFSKIFCNTIREISLSNEEINSYNKLGIEYFKMIIDDHEYFLRSKNSIIKIKELFSFNIPLKSFCFKINNGIKNYSGIDLINLSYNASDNNTSQNLSKLNFEYLFCIFNEQPKGVSKGVSQSHLEVDQSEDNYMWRQLFNNKKIKNFDRNGNSSQYRMCNPSGFLEVPEAGGTVMWKYIGHGGIMLVNFKNTKHIFFEISINELLSVDEISKISKYTIEPIK